jgi:hypothetical protein
MGIVPLTIVVVVIAVVAVIAWMLWKGAVGTAKAAVQFAHEGKDDKRKPKQLIEPTWGRSEDDGPPLTELTAEHAGSLSPFGEDHSFPLPQGRLRYAHPTDKPNRAGLMAGRMG